MFMARFKVASSPASLAPGMLCLGGAYVTAEEMDPKIEGKSIEVRLVEGEMKIRILN